MKPGSRGRLSSFNMCVHIFGFSNAKISIRGFVSWCVFTIEQFEIEYEIPEEPAVLDIAISLVVQAVVQPMLSLLAPDL